MPNYSTPTVGKLVGAGEEIQPSPATHGTGYYSHVVSATNTGNSTFTSIEIEGTVGGKHCTWLVDTGAQVSIVQESLAAQARGSKIECQFVPHTVDGFWMGTVYGLVTDCQVGNQHIFQHRLRLLNSQHTPQRLQLLAWICCLVYRCIYR